LPSLDENFLLIELKNLIEEKDAFLLQYFFKPTTPTTRKRLILLIEEMKSNFQEYN